MKINLTVETDHPHNSIEYRRLWQDAIQALKGYVDGPTKLLVNEEWVFLQHGTDKISLWRSE